jgi:hypothetical protein
VLSNIYNEPKCSLIYSVDRSSIPYLNPPMDSGSINVNLEFQSNMQKKQPTQSLIAKTTCKLLTFYGAVLRFKVALCFLSRTTFFGFCSHSFLYILFVFDDLRCRVDDFTHGFDVLRCRFVEI